MAWIAQLPQQIADMIAAGEVADRPAGVVKELVENAIDAGASAITVEVQRGGMESIRVIDNGCGIAIDELPVAFLRHATSKLHTEEDLAAIGTLGFRGEALAAISAVSKVEIISHKRNMPQGARLILTGGEAGEVEEYGCPEGTSIYVRELFFNTPARLKFMKKDSAEAAAAAAVVQHAALSHPCISFKWIKDGKEQMYTPGDGKLLSAIYTALGRDFALSLIPVEGSLDSTGVTGYVTKCINCRGTRAMQHFFVNGRYIKSQLLTAAVEEAYRNRMMKGKFPGCVLQLSIPLDAVDVNVHPSKNIVKFVDERIVFSTVYHAVKNALTQDEARGSVSLSAGITMQQQNAFFQNMTAAEYRNKANHGTRENSAARSSCIMPSQRASVLSVNRRSDGEGAPGSTVEDISSTVQNTAANAAVFTPQTPATDMAAPSPSPRGGVKEPLPPPAAAAGASVAASAACPAPRETEQELTAGQETGTEVEAPPSIGDMTATQERWKIAGEILRTYIIAEDGEGNVYLIDKHAAHERLNFDRMRKEAAPIPRQQLLRSETVRLKADEYSILLEHLPLLEAFGFETEDFGNNTLLCRSCPPELDAADIVPAIEEIAGQLLCTGHAEPGDARDAILRIMACKASIRAGMHNDRLELERLVEKVQCGEIAFCPHGRPVAVKMTRYEIEKMFKRA